MALIRKQACWAAAFLVAFLLVGWFAYFAVGLPVRRSHLALLNPSMGTNEVAALLGHPKSVQSVVGATVWIYESPAHLFAVQIFFDGLGNYQWHAREL